MSDILAIAVVIPARNEAELIAQCLESVKRASSDLREDAGLEVTVTIVADGCADATANVARSAGANFVLETTPVGVGAARRLGVAHALGQSRFAPSDVWIANTDADSVVHRLWLRNQVRAARAGAHVRIGAVKPNFRELNRSQVAAWRRTHRGGSSHEFAPA